jgi:hypothetical protein
MIAGTEAGAYEKNRYQTTNISSTTPMSPSMLFALMGTSKPDAEDRPFSHP